MLFSQYKSKIMDLHYGNLFNLLPHHAQTIDAGHPVTRAVLQKSAESCEPMCGVFLFRGPKYFSAIADLGMSEEAFVGHLNKLISEGILRIHNFTDCIGLTIPSYESTRHYQQVRQDRENDRGRFNGGDCSKGLRSRVYKAFQRCEYCGCVPSDPQVDRILAGRRGGMYVPENVTLSCRSCNMKKKDRDYIGPVRSLAIMEACK